MREPGPLLCADPASGKIWPLVRALAAAGLVSAILGGCAMTESKNTSRAAAPEMQIRPSPLIIRGDKSPDGYYALGKYYFYQGRLDKAKGAFLDAVRLDPGHVDALNGLGAVYDRLGQYDSAQKAYGAALLKDPQAAHVWANLGYSFMLAGKGSESIEPLQKAARLDPTNALARQHLASASAAAENVDVAPTAAPVPAVTANQPPETVPKATVHPGVIVASVETAAPGPEPFVQKAVATQSNATPLSRPVGPIESVVSARPAHAAEASPAPVIARARSPASEQGLVEPMRVSSSPSASPGLAVAARSTSASPTQSVSTAQVPAAASVPSEGPVASVVTSKGATAPVAQPAQPAKVAGPSASPVRADVKTVAPAVAKLDVRPARDRVAATQANALPVSDRTASRLSELLGGLRIEISNGNGVTGMARAVGTEMRQTGLNIARITNARPFNKPQTVIMCRAELKSVALELAQAMPAKPKIVLSDIGHRRVDVRVVLGADSALARKDGFKSPYLVASLSR